MSEKHLSLDELARTLRNSVGKSSADAQKAESLRTINFLPFIPPPSTHFSIDQKTGKMSPQYNDILNKYSERLQYTVNDLELLLKLSFKSFYNQIINDKTFHEFLSTFLKYSPRPYEFIEFEMNNLLPDDIKFMLDTTKRLVFFILHRLSSENEETKSIDMAPVLMSPLFDLSNLFDLSVLYEENVAVEKLIREAFRSNLANHQLKFKNSISIMTKGFKTNETRLQDLFELNNNILKHAYMYRDETHGQIMQQVNYFIDMAITLSSFTRITPALSVDLLKARFDNDLLEFIEHTAFEIEETLTKLSRREKNENIQTIALKLQILKFELSKLLDKMLDQCIISPITDKDYDSSHLELFYSSYLNILGFKRFLTYFAENFELLAKLNRVYKVAKDKIDKSQYDYIMDNIKSVVRSDVKKVVVQNESVTAAAAKISELKISESIDKTSEGVRSLLEIFPEYNEKFLKECLEYFNLNKDQLINAILENNLPECLQSKLRPSVSQEASVQRSVFDGDQFDIKKNKEATDFTRVHIGKKNTTDNLLVREPVFKANFIQTQLSYNDGEYDDEYDDTYDDKMDVYQTDDAFDIKPLNAKLDLPKRAQFEKDDEEEDEQVAQGGQATASTASNAAQPLPQRKRNMDFAEDPAKQRERQQERYEAKQAQYAARQQHRQYHNRDNNSEEAKPEDNEARVQQERKYKNANKAKMVHHDRKNFATKKQNRGLLD